jgi:hypothetical protein
MTVSDNCERSLYLLWTITDNCERDCMAVSDDCERWLQTMAVKTMTVSDDLWTTSMNWL